MRTLVAAVFALLGLGLFGETAGRVLPGPRADGSTLLHSQWPIHPAGRQIPLGDFPVALALDRRGGFAAVLHAGHGRHEIRLVDLETGSSVSAPIREGFCGLAFSKDGRTLVGSGGSDRVLHVFGVSSGRLNPEGDVRVAPAGDPSVLAGFALAGDMRSAIAALLFTDRVVRVDLASGRILWTLDLDPGRTAGPGGGGNGLAPNSAPSSEDLVRGSEPLNVAWDEGSGRAYVSLWGESAVAVVDAASGRLLGRLPTGLHPNELVLSRDGRLFVSNGGVNSVTVLGTGDGRQSEVLSSSAAPGDPPGSTPDSLALSADGRTLFVANASTNTLAVFDVSVPGSGRPLGFVPTGWFPSSVRLTPDGRRLLFVSARGLLPKASGGKGRPWEPIGELYPGSLGVVDLPAGDGFARALAGWTRTAQRCRPAAAPAAPPGGPVPEAAGGASPIRYVVYIVRENRTYDQVLGDVPEGNGDPSLCLFPRSVTPNAHALSRKFVLLDNFYANAEVSASGHEWSMGAYASEFVEKTWPTNYGHGSRATNLPYPAEGRFAAAVPALGYLWDRAAAAGVTYRSYGEFTDEELPRGSPMASRLDSLHGHVDPGYRGWDIGYPDRKRAGEFIRQLSGYEASGEMPRLQIVRLPQDHTAGAAPGHPTPRAMVADNDLALGEIVEALSRSRFWERTAVFVVEDDAQDGPDHVDAHRTVALVAGGYVRRGAVDSTPYTTCSLLRTVELILGLGPMSTFDSAAVPMRGCFQAAPDLSGYRALAPDVDLGEMNPGTGPLARASRRFDFSHADLVDERAFNRVIWSAVRGEGPMPAPVRAAYVRSLAGDGDDD
jgi:hypothetical protein